MNRLPVSSEGTGHHSEKGKTSFQGPRRGTFFANRAVNSSGRLPEQQIIPVLTARSVECDPAHLMRRVISASEVVKPTGAALG